MLPARLVLLALSLAISLIGSPRAIASTVVVPDDFLTVQLGIASGADTVLVREGTYSETPVIERDLVLRGIGVSRRPRLSGLSISNLLHPRSSTVIGFDISNTVVYSNMKNKSPITVTLSDCAMDGGIQANADNGDAHLLLVLRHCRMPYVAGGLDAIVMEADTLDGGVSLNLWSNPVDIRHCWFRGGAGAAITLTREPAAFIAHNLIENYAVSISAPWAVVEMDGNTISGCGAGIDVRYEAYIRNNVIRGCGVGILCGSQNNVWLTNNTVLDISGNGIVAQPEGALYLQGNIVGFCGGNGIVLSSPYMQPYEVDVRNNTIFNNRGSGVVWNTQPYSATLRGNIGYGNAGWGLTTQPGAQIDLGCNDWFQNGSGATSGVAMAPSDLSVDPMFCDAAVADVTLNSASPLLNAAGCGQIGAMGVGCGATPTLVQRFTAGRVSDGVRVVWQVAAGATATEIWVERAEGVRGEAWTRPATERLAEGGTLVELDRTALPDRAYRYRLVALDGGRLNVLDAGVLVPAAARVAFALAEVGPSPGGGPLRITFTLAHAAAIRIDVFDLLGRQVSTPAQGIWPAGIQVVGWDGLTQTGISAPAGMYVVRYAYPGGQDRRSVMRIR